MTDAETWNTNYERVQKARKELGQINKSAIFAALADNGIEFVHVKFDGVGDQGQIEDVTSIRNGQSVEPPDVKVTLLQALWERADPDITEAGLREAIETLCYDFLEQGHGGWENDDGAFGEFTLDVAARTVKLEFDGRFTEISTSHHSF